MRVACLEFDALGDRGPVVVFRHTLNFVMLIAKNGRGGKKQVGASNLQSLVNKERKKIA